MMGKHCIKTWAKTQATIAKSSAESELYACVKGACEALGMVTMMKELGREVVAVLHIDSSAAKGIIERTGLHKVRHLDVAMLWVQSKVAKDMLKVKKIKGEENNADLMTKHLTQATLTRHMHGLGLFHKEGRSGRAAKLHAVSLGNAISVRDVAWMKDGQLKGKNGWGERGERGAWTYLHCTPRNQLFTPSCARKGPGNNDMVSSVRITTGRYASGEDFTIVDKWDDIDSAKRKLKSDWTGKTTFWQIGINVERPTIVQQQSRSVSRLASRLPRGSVDDC